SGSEEPRPADPHRGSASSVSTACSRVAPRRVGRALHSGRPIAGREERTEAPRRSGVSLDRTGCFRSQQVTGVAFALDRRATLLADAADLWIEPGRAQRSGAVFNARALTDGDHEVFIDRGGILVASDYSRVGSSLGRIR